MESYREKYLLAERYFVTEIAEGSFGAGMLKGFISESA